MIYIPSLFNDLSWTTLMITKNELFYDSVAHNMVIIFYGLQNNLLYHSYESKKFQPIDNLEIHNIRVKIIAVYS